MDTDTKTIVETQDPKEKYGSFESNLKRLIWVYLEVFNSINIEPAISVRGLFVLYGKYAWWALNFFFLPFILIIDIFIFILNRFKEQKREYIKGVTVDYTIRAIRAIRKGDLPFLKLIILRYFTRLFVSNHIKTRLRSISAFLQSEEIRVLFSSGDNTETLKKIRDDVEKLSKLEKILSKSVELKIILTVASFWGAVTWVLKFLGFDISKESFKSVWARIQLLTDSSLFRPLLALVFFLVIMIIFGGLFALVSSFVRKRELMLSQNVYELEHSFFTTEHIPHQREFPLDIVGWIVGWIVFLLPLLLQPQPGETPDQPLVISLLSLGLCAFAYALFRRIKLGKY